MATNAKLSIRLSDNISLTLEDTNVKDAISVISEFAEYFGVGQCGACESTDLQYMHRTAQGYNFYEIKCRSCTAKLGFGETREGGRLFPKRKDKDGNWLDAGGWEKYVSPTQTANAEGADPF